MDDCIPRNARERKRKIHRKFENYSTCGSWSDFVLHKVWGHCLARHAMKHSAMNQSQFALPGQTCNNTVLNKLLFLDLSRQTLCPGIMTDYDATATFDRVLAGLSIVTCQRMGLPYSAGTFMFHLLRNMNFHLMMGFGRSVSSYNNSTDPTSR